MTPETVAWRSGLVAFLEEERKRPRHHSVAAPEPAVIAEAQRIVSRSVQKWLGETLARQLIQRHQRAVEIPGLDRDAVILLTTTPLGLEIAERLVSSDLRGIICLLEVEYRRWCRIQPDDEMRHHVTAWNWVKTSLPTVRQNDFPAYPLSPGEQYWLHRTGIAGTTDEELRNTALLAFDGTHSRLLAASTVETRFED